jgi:competence protein ComEC
MLRPRLPVDPLDRLIANTRPWWQRSSQRVASYMFRLWLTGAVVWTVALPLTMYRFHVMSPSALVLNSLLWLPITAALYFGFATLTIGWLLPPVGAICGRACDGLLALVDACITYGGDHELSYQWLPGPALWWVLGFYLVLGVYVVLPRFRYKLLWAVALLSVWCAIGLAASERSPMRDYFSPEPQLRCTFIAVGHGTSVLLEFPDGQTLLYDAGHMGTPGGGAEAISSVLWSRGITQLDAVMISHADADHYNALPELLQRFDVREVYVSPVMFQLEPDGVKILHGAIDKAGVPIVNIHGGESLKFGPLVRGEILHPPQRGVPGSDNANSLVLAVEFAGRRILLPGDLETPGLEDVLAELPLDCDIVMAPHHGSARSNPRGFAQWSTPEWVVISGSRARDASVVVDAYRSYGAEVIHTAHENAVQFILTPSGLAVETWYDNAWHARRHHASK